MSTNNQQLTTINHQPTLKVCGLTKLNQIKELIDLKIDFLGFIFYEKSPRYVLNYLRLKQISEINHQGKVGVFVNEELEKIIKISEQANLNFIQLHADETEDFISELRKKLNSEIKIIKVIRVGSEKTEVKSEIKKVFDSAQTDNHQPKTINYLLFDTDSKAFGGTGKTFDWNVLNEIEIPVPYFLSGGISLENINQLSTINHQPIALDINSKFEIEAGNKDLEKIKEFINLLKIPKGTI
ncbi:phosphoribosylanthranilate isomerase [Chryseobacterium binzhouense]|uniref:phosphoribosylanthranilate isomerase n=1 Tax=Chryseobacterium binzhouense TaxID=2593646 RepID=UPI00289800D2|nr:phosphoribosylanthranilate isomerase [Chryseobacterium binzhouense]